jgi:hypothetical protein
MAYNRPTNEFSITGWLDPALKYFAEQAKIPVDQYSAQVGGEGIGNALEFIANLFTKGWLNKGIQFATGLIADGYAVWGKDVPVRLRRELLALGTHELLRIVNITPEEAVQFRESLDSFISAVQRGDWNAALASILKSPAELKAMFGLTEKVTPPPAPASQTPMPTPTPSAEMKGEEVTPERLY